jgi:hypothetical protein
MPLFFLPGTLGQNIIVKDILLAHTAVKGKMCGKLSVMRYMDQKWSLWKF